MASTEGYEDDAVAFGQRSTRSCHRRAVLPFADEDRREDMKTLAREHDKTEILRRLSTLGPGSVRRWVRMSVHQMLCHLGDGLLMGLGSKDVSLVPGPYPRTVLRWAALYMPLPWPHGIPTRPEIDPLRKGTR